MKGTSGTLSGLVENTQYTIAVQAMTGDGRKSAVNSEVSVLTHAAGKPFNKHIKDKILRCTVGTIHPLF